MGSPIRYTIDRLHFKLLLIQHAAAVSSSARVILHVPKIYNRLCSSVGICASTAGLRARYQKYVLTREYIKLASIIKSALTVNFINI